LAGSGEETAFYSFFLLFFSGFTVNQH